MRAPLPSAQDRAERMLRWYPLPWRERYGAEFVELLSAEFDETPYSWHRGANVISSGTVARLTNSGLVGPVRSLEEQSKWTVAWLGAAAALFCAFAITVLSQLAVGWQWEHPYTGGERVASILMSLGIELALVLVVLAALPIGWTLLRRVCLGKARGVRLPALSFAVGAVVLLVGSAHFANGWPGTGGHRGLTGALLLPRSIANVLWAMTMSISSEWAHPNWLHALPTSQLMWMALSPVALVMSIAGAVLMVRRLELSGEVVRFELAIGRLATVVMTMIMAGAIAWFSDAGGNPLQRPSNLFQLGTIDSVAVLAMGFTLLFSLNILRRSRQRPLLRASG